MILGKTNHPVQIKQIPLHTWSLRAEIEMALESCLKEDGTIDEEKSKEVKAFYDQLTYPNQAKVSKLSAKKEDNQKQDSGEVDTTDVDTDDKSNKVTKAEDEYFEPVRFRPSADKFFMGRSLLSDIQMDSIIFFSEKEYTPGQTIALEIVTAKPFCLYLNIVNIVNFSRDSKIITPRKLGYRILGKFLFASDQQKAKLRNFLEKIEPEILTQERLKNTQDKIKKDNDPLEIAEKEEQTSANDEA